MASPENLHNGRHHELVEVDRIGHFNIGSYEYPYEERPLPGFMDLSLSHHAECFVEEVMKRFKLTEYTLPEKDQYVVLMTSIEGLNVGKRTDYPLDAKHKRLECDAADPKTLASCFTVVSHSIADPEVDTFRIAFWHSSTWPTVTTPRSWTCISRTR